MCTLWYFFLLGDLTQIIHDIYLIYKSYIEFTSRNLGVGTKQCNTNFEFLTEYKYEYIRNGKFYQIRISNIFLLSKFVEYEYRIYSFLANGRIQISNIFVLSKLFESEYRIYSFQQIGRIRIPNIFVICKLLEYEYRIYS